MKKASLSGLGAISCAYPANMGRGYFAAYLLEDGLSAKDKRDRRRWLEHLAKPHRVFHLIERHLDRADFRQAFREAVSSHGVFYDRFFDHAVGFEVRAAARSAAVDQEQLSAYMAEYWGRGSCDPQFDTLPVQALMRLKDLYIKELLEDDRRLSELKNWFVQASAPRSCVVCGATFAPVNLHPSVYFGSRGQTKICLNCPVVGAPTKKELFRLVPVFARSCGFIPSSSASPTSFHFMSREMAEPIEKVVEAYARMGGIGHVKKKFGSWFEALAVTGALPNGTLVTPRGIRCLANDGHVCHSLDERRIDDWLSANKISHVKEPNYPSHATLNSRGLRRGDWLVEGRYLEYFGLVGEAAYDKKIEEKLLLGEELGLEVVPIYPRDISNLGQKLGFLL